MDKLKKNFPILNIPTSFFNVATCKVEVYGVQKETVTSVYKFLFQILFSPCMDLLYMSQQWRRRLVHSELEDYIILFSLSIEA